MSDYSPVTAEALAELREIAGANYVITDAEKLEPYSRDESVDRRHGRMPEAVVKPRTAAEISRIMLLANRARIPVTPRGAGSGLAGGAVPIRGGLVLSLERFDSIIEIDERNMMATVEPGVVTNEINDALKPLGLFYAGYPMSVETCSIGGNVATNAGGGKAVKYGVTERYVLGLEVVLPTGEIITVGGKRIKEVTGYNLRRLFVGSEGTLGIVTRIILKLTPLPRHVVALLALFGDPAAAIAVVPKLMTLGGVVPTAVEFMDRLSVRVSCEYLNEHLPYQEAGAMLLLELDGNDEEVVRREYEVVGELCLGNGALEVFVADNQTTRERLWNVRRNIAEAFSAISPDQSQEDVVVPPAAIPEVVAALEELARKHGMLAPCFGHAGDGNLHARLARLPDDSREEWERKLPAALRELYDATKRLGGTISGEHGIGCKRKEYLGLFLSPDEIALQRRLKRAFDPNNVLNPGKIVD